MRHICTCAVCKEKCALGHVRLYLAGVLRASPPRLAGQVHEFLDVPFFGSGDGRGDGAAPIPAGLHSCLSYSIDRLLTDSWIANHAPFAHKNNVSQPPISGIISTSNRIANPFDTTSTRTTIVVHPGNTKIHHRRSGFNGL